MDYISHHALHSHIPIHHYTNHTAVTIHSLALFVLPHLHLIHTHTFKQHSHMHSPRSLVLAPADISERFPCILLPCVWPRTARPWNSEPVLVTSTPAWYCLRLCSASDIPVVVRWPLPVWFCLINLTASGSTRLRPVITYPVLGCQITLIQHFCVGFSLILMYFINVILNSIWLSHDSSMTLRL